MKEKHPEEKQNPDKAPDNDSRQRKRVKLNPRIVFNDPDSFFKDLLMEQQEQH